MSEKTRLNDGSGSDLKIATPADFGITRDEDGELKPIKQKVPGSDDLAIRVKPVVDVEPVAEALEGTNPPDARVDELAEKYIVEGPGATDDDLTLSDYPDYVVNAILQAVKDASGHQYFRAAEKRRVKENAEMEAEVIDSVGIEKLNEIANAGRDTNTKQP